MGIVFILFDFFFQPNHLMSMLTVMPKLESFWVRWKTSTKLASGWRKGRKHPVAAWAGDTLKHDAPSLLCLFLRRSISCMRKSSTYMESLPWMVAESLCWLSEKMQKSLQTDDVTDNQVLRKRKRKRTETANSENANSAVDKAQVGFLWFWFNLLI